MISNPVPMRGVNAKKLPVQMIQSTGFYRRLTNVEAGTGISFPVIGQKTIAREQDRMTEKWSHRIGFLFAAIGSAVGLGSVWRFPFVVGENGGGAYLIPYLVAVFLCATPLMVLEFSMGRYFATDVVSAFRRVHARFALIGWIICAVVFSILSYYLVITGWTLAFTVFSATGTPASFGNFSSSYEPIAFFVISAIIVGLVVSAGIRRGIERVSSILIPFIVLILAAMAVFVATLPGFAAGIAYYLTPDFSVLSDPSLWISAVGQSFYTLSIGMGILITYGAYLGREENLLESSLIISVADLAISLLSGLVIFPIVFSFGLTPALGAELAFSTLPKGFAVMPSGHLFATGFFLLLFLTALLSSVSMLEVVVAAVMGRTAWPRERVCAVLTIAVVLLGLPAALSYTGLNLTFAGERVLDLMDDITGTFCITITGILTSLAFSWFVDRRIIVSEIRSESRVVCLIVPLCRYVLPLILTGILLLTVASRITG